MKASELNTRRGTLISVPNSSGESTEALGEDEEEEEEMGGIGSIQGSRVIPRVKG